MVLCFHEPLYFRRSHPPQIFSRERRLGVIFNKLTMPKKLLEIRQRIMASGRPLLDWDDIDREMVAQRRGEWPSEEKH